MAIGILELFAWKDDWLILVDGENKIALNPVSNYWHQKFNGLRLKEFGQSDRSAVIKSFSTLEQFCFVIGTTSTKMYKLHIFVTALQLHYQYSHLYRKRRNCYSVHDAVHVLINPACNISLICQI